MIGDMPTMTKAAHAHSLYSASDWTTPINSYAGTTTGTGLSPFLNVGVAAQAQPPRVMTPAMLPNKVPKPKKETTMQARRLVQVYIADPDENVPLEKSLLYSGTQKLTDLTDQELFFDIDMRTILEAHNAYRITVVNRKVKERVENLEPVKIRDLRMVVVDVATFS